MSIDTSMYALLNNAPNPAALFSQGLQAGQQNKLARMQMEQATAQAAEAKQAKEQKNRLAQLLGMPENYDTGGNLKREALPQIAAIDPAQYPTYQKQIADQAKAAREQEKAELAAKREQFTTYGQIIGSARDQASYERALGALQRMGVDVSKESPTFDPNAVSQALQMTLTGAQQIEQVWKAKQFDLDTGKAAEVARHNKAAEGHQAGQLEIARGQLGVSQANLGLRKQEIGQKEREIGGQGKAPSGFRWKADGSLEAIPGGPGDKAAAATEGERKAATLLRRLEGSKAQLDVALKDDPGAAKPGVIASGLRSMGAEALANGADSSSRQRVESAQLDMLDAALTLGTGAAYTREQLKGYAKSYFPQINDTPDAIKDKSERLKTVIEAAKIAAGRAASGTTKPTAPLKDGGVKFLGFE